MRVRLPRVALLALMLPACLSGFAEIHVSGGDASADRPAVDRPTTDTPRPSDSAHDVLAVDAPVADVVSLVDGMPEDRADAVAANDAATGMDAGDAGEDAPVAMDRVELRDVVPEDRAAADVVDATAACLGGCMAGEECVEGRCGRWVQRAAHPLDLAPYFSTSDVVDALDRFCDTWAPSVRARVCRSTDGVQPCGNGAAVVGDRDLVRSEGGAHLPGCVRCVDGGVSAANGAECGRIDAVACCVFRPR